MSKFNWKMAQFVVIFKTSRQIFLEILVIAVNGFPNKT